MRYLGLVTKRKAPATVGERLIKRYDNRKLYDPGARSYVTIADLARMIGRGDEIRVEDQKTGEDLTTVVLAQVVLEGLKQRTAQVPRQVLARLIRLGSVPSAAIAVPHNAAARAREEAERIVSGLLSRGRLTLEEALGLRQEIAQSVQRIVVEAQHGIEARLHGVIQKATGPHPTASLEALKDRLLAFETYLSEPKRKTATKKARR